MPAAPDPASPAPCTAPRPGLAARLAGTLVRGYQYLVSPLLGPVCRYHPSCSDYARESLYTHGLARGSWLALRRLGRCHPWGGSGYDPVPCAPRAGDAGSGDPED